jgi:hypothetical protein
MKILSEARRGDTPKRSVLEILSQYKDKKDVLVSFRNHVIHSDRRNNTLNSDPGVGINPFNEYDTPTGIYGYVLAPMWEANFKTKTFPFASDRPSIVVYEPADGYTVIRSSDFTKDDLDEKLQLITEVTSYTIDAINDIISSLDNKYKQTPFRTLWSVARQISVNEIQKKKNDKPIKFLGGCHHCALWSNLMIRIGCPIMIDDIDSGSIHYNEPTQSVAFGKKFIKVLERIENKNWKAVGEKSFQVLERNINMALNNGKYPHKAISQAMKLKKEYGSAIAANILSFRVLREVPEEHFSIFNNLGEYSNNMLSNFIKYGSEKAAPVPEKFIRYLESRIQSFEIDPSVSEDKLNEIQKYCIVLFNLYINFRKKIEKDFIYKFSYVFGRADNGLSCKTNTVSKLIKYIDTHWHSQTPNEYMLLNILSNFNKIPVPTVLLVQYIQSHEMSTTMWKSIEEAILPDEGDSLQMFYHNVANMFSYDPSVDQQASIFDSWPQSLIQGILRRLEKSPNILSNLITNRQDTFLNSKVLLNNLSPDKKVELLYRSLFNSYSAIPSEKRGKLFFQELQANPHANDVIDKINATGFIIDQNISSLYSVIMTAPQELKDLIWDKINKNKKTEIVIMALNNIQIDSLPMSKEELYKYLEGELDEKYNVVDSLVRSILNSDELDKSRLITGDNVYWLLQAGTGYRNPRNLYKVLRAVEYIYSYIKTFQPFIDMSEKEWNNYLSYIEFGPWKVENGKELMVSTIKHLSETDNLENTEEFYRYVSAYIFEKNSSLEDLYEKSIDKISIPYLTKYDLVYIGPSSQVVMFDLLFGVKTYQGANSEMDYQNVSHYDKNIYVRKEDWEKLFGPLPDEIINQVNTHKTEMKQKFLEVKQIAFTPEYQVQKLHNGEPVVPVGPGQDDPTLAQILNNENLNFYYKDGTYWSYTSTGNYPSTNYFLYATTWEEIFGEKPPEIFTKDQSDEKFEEIKNNASPETTIVQSNGDKMIWLGKGQEPNILSILQKVKGAKVDYWDIVFAYKSSGEYYFNEGQYGEDPKRDYYMILSKWQSIFGKSPTLEGVPKVKDLVNDDDAKKLKAKKKEIYNNIFDIVETIKDANTENGVQDLKYVGEGTMGETLYDRLKVLYPDFQTTDLFARQVDSENGTAQYVSDLTGTSPHVKYFVTAKMWETIYDTLVEEGI